MTRGLWHDRERYLETYWSRWPDVWWHGDFASVTDDGQWFLHGRSDDTIKVAGKRLGPAEVETVARRPSRPCSRRPRSAFPTSVKGEALWVFVVPRPGVSRRRRAARRAARRASPSTSARRSGRPRCASPTRCRRRAAPRCCAARSARSRPAREPGDLSGLEDPGGPRRDRGGPLTCTSSSAPACCCGRCGPTTGTRGARSASACREWLETVGAAPEPGSADPALDREAFRARCGAWERQRHFDAAYGFGLFLTRRPVRGRGEPRERAARPVPDGATSATGSTRRSPAAATCPKASCC